ncbi:MAG: bacteriohemerythrin [Chromatiales bacterium]|nr:bacteriohemerythrin [Chromatiales bacterium]
MAKQTFNIFVAVTIGLLVVAIGLSFLFGLDNPVSWVLIAIVVLIPLIYKKFSEDKQLVWKESYSVGVKALDDDHKKLIELLNQFRVAYTYHTSEEFEKQALKDLIDYTKYHFEKEENLMAQAGYPDLEDHKAQHRVMIEQVEIFLEDYGCRGHESLEGVAAYLEGWLINHINGTDKQYGPYLNKQNIV